MRLIYVEAKFTWRPGWRLKQGIFFEQIELFWAGIETQSSNRSRIYVYFVLMSSHRQLEPCELFYM